MGNDTTKYARSYSAGDGRLVVGRAYTDRDLLHVSAQVDELIFFNKALSTTDITAMYNGV